MTATLSLAPDAAMVLGIASTALPFARTPEDEAERWLRVLRLHGQAGQALQALGVGEQRLTEPGEGADAGASRPAAERDPVAEVTERAVRIAGARGAECVQTTDVLMGAMDVYGPEFNRALEAHGTDRAELTQRLSDQFGVRIA